MSADPVAVLYCIDDAYVPQAAVSLGSLFDNAPGARFEVTIAAFQRDPALSEAAFAPVLARHPRCSLRFVDLPDQLFQDLPVTGQFSRSIYIRLILQRFIDHPHRRILYLDADTIACEDITPLWQTNMGDATLAAAPDPFHLNLTQTGFSEDQFYFNSGVLLIDMERWRARNCEKRVLDVLAQRAHELAWMDQDALNMALGGETHILDLKWNWQPRCADVPAGFLGLDRAAYDKRRARPAVIHYTTSFKPWNSAYRVHYSARFFAAAQASGVPSALLPAPAQPRSASQRLLQLKTGLRWRAPGAFRTMRKLFRPKMAAEMYRAGPSR